VITRILSRKSRSRPSVPTRPASPTYAANIPVFIICRDRVTTLSKLVARLERAGQTRIVLVDNSSTYPPLLDYLSSTTHNVLRTGRNDGPSSPWTSGLVSSCDGPFIVTDPDLVPDDSCPDDFVAALVDALDVLKPRGIVKVGMGLRVDDLPPTSIGNSVRDWEAPRFWTRVIGHGPRGEPWYDAAVDTTFAIYKPHARYDAGCAKAVRLGPPYLMRCDPWYERPESISDEERYYCEHADRASNQAAHMRRLLAELSR
jgi:hypothetical protein